MSIGLRPEDLCETIHDQRVEIDRLKADNEKLGSELWGFVEYFSAIERKELGGNRPFIRTFEKLLLDKARRTLKELEQDK